MNRSVLALFIFAFAAVNACYGQAVAGMGAISGVVRDATGASIAGATVVVANEGKGIRRNLESNEAGVFNAPALVPSSGYGVTATKSGFAQYVSRNIDIAVGQTLNLNVTLEVAASATQVEVTGATPIVETTKTDVSQVVGSKQIMDLPINGRRVDSFVLLTPGVVSDGTFGLVSFRGVAGGNSFLTDGNDTTNTFYSENAGRTRISSQISQDAVQEFQVLTNGYSAEFGHASGGVVNTVTRSGTNDVHGTGYWFFRNRTLNATDRYAQGYNPPEVRHQAGGSLGGHIIKDKLFYFVNAETTRREFPALNRVTGSNLFNSRGDFIAPCGTAVNGVTPSPAQCTAARNFITRQNNVLVPRTANSELGFGKLDWRPNDRHSVSGSFNYLRWISPNGIQTQAVLTNAAALGNNADSSVRTRYGRLAWSDVLSNTMVNEFRFGYFKDRLFDDFNASFVPPETGRIGLTVFGQSNLSSAIDYPRLNPSEQRFELADNLSWTAGRHTLKFGFNYLHTQDYLNILRNQFGSYTYADFNRFALDFSGNAARLKNWQSYSQTFGNPILDLRTKDYSGYVQDQFRATRALTLNFGLRYDYADLPQPTVVNPAYPTLTGRINKPGKNFAPRAGLAYAFEDQKTVLRAGYGIFFQRVPGSLIQQFFFNNGVYQPQVSLNGTTAGDLAAGPVLPARLATNGSLPSGSVELQFAAKDFRTPYTQQGDIAIERQLTANLGLTVSYVFSRGVALFTSRDLDVGALGDPVTYRINDLGGNQVGSYTTPTYRLANRVDPRFRRLIQVENGGISYYNGLITQLQRRFSHGLQGSVAYTWSHAIDDANQGGGNDVLFFSTLRSTYNGDYRSDRGSSLLDQRHRLVVNSIYQPTFTKSTSAFAKFFVNNWQLSQITTVASSQPTTATIQVTSNFPGAAFTNTLNGFGGSTRAPFFPFNNLDVDRIFRTDARLTKGLPITERFQIFLNFEAFNVFNTQYNTGIISQAYTANNLVLTPNSRLNEGNQSQGFPDGTNARRMQASLRFVF